MTFAAPTAAKPKSQVSVSRLAFDRNASTLAGTTSMPNTAAISWQVSGLCPRRTRSATT